MAYPAAKTLMGAGDVLMAAKPILSAAQNLSKYGKIGEEVANVAKDLTSPRVRTAKLPAVRTIRYEKVPEVLAQGGNQMRELPVPIKRNVMVERKVPVDFESKTFRSLSRPGLTIKDVSRGKSNLAEEFAREVKPLSDYQKRGQAIVQKGIQNVEEKLKMPRYSSEDTNRLLGEAQYGVEQRFGDFKNAFSRLIGEHEASKTRAMQEASAIGKVPQEFATDVIKGIENPSHRAAPEVKGIIQQFRNKYDELFQNARDAGIDLGYLKNYITHIWEQPQAQVEEMYKIAKKGFTYASPRVVPTYEEGIAMGLTPKFTNPTQILAEYVRKLEQTKANINFLNTLRKTGFVVDASIGSRQAGFSPINAPGFTRSISKGPEGATVIGNLYAPNEIAKIINRVFSPEDTGLTGKLFGGTAFVSGKFQDIALSGGIPKTPVNAWTFAQMTKEALTGRMRSPFTSALRALSGNRSIKFFEKNAGQIEKMQLRNVPISTNWDVASLSDDGFIRNTFGNKWGETWNKVISEPTFRRFMPMLQINLFNDIEARALRKGLLPQEAADVAAKAVNNFYGLTRTDTSAQRSKIGKDILTTFTFAPQYREAIMKFWANNVKAFKNPFALENQMNLRFLAGAGITLGAMDYLNHKFNGRHMWENPRWTEDKLLIPLPNGTTIGVPFLSSIATLPRLGYRMGKALLQGDVSGAGKDFFQTTVSMMIKPFADVFANSDYFGNQIVNEEDLPGEKFKKIGKYLGTQYTGHPYIKAALGSKDKPGFQVLSEALETPLRFYKQDSLIKREFYDAFKRYEPLAQKYEEYRQYGDDPKANEFYNAHKDEIETYYKWKPYEKVFNKFKYDDKNPQENIDILQKAISEVKKGAPLQTAFDSDIEYKKAIDEAIREMGPDEKVIFDKLRFAKQYDENGLPIANERQKMSNALDRLWNPGILEKESRIAQKVARATGEPMNPLYALSPDQQRVVLLRDTFYPGEETESRITKENIDWLKPFWDARSKYFDYLKDSGKMKDSGQNVVKWDGKSELKISQVDVLLPADNINDLMDAYYKLPYGTGQRSAFISAHPELKNYWDSSAELKNLQRISLGLPEMQRDQFGGGGYGYYRGGSKKKTAKAKPKASKVPGKVYVEHPRLEPELRLAIRKSSVPSTSKTYIIKKAPKKQLKQPKKYVIKLGSKTLT
jgi:hypothetical protein